MSEMPVVMPDMAAVAQLFVDYNTFFHVYPRYVGLYGLFTEVAKSYLCVSHKTF